MNEITVAWISCVRWDRSGNMLASVSWDGTVKLLESRIEKVVYAKSTSDGSNFLWDILFSPYHD